MAISEAAARHGKPLVELLAERLAELENEIVELKIRITNLEAKA